MLHDMRVRKLDHIKNGLTVFGGYIKLYALACEIGDCGRIYITDETPYTARDFAQFFGETERTARVILDTLVEVGLIFIDDAGFIKLLAWDEEQAAGKSPRKSAKKQKTLHTTDTDKELDKELEKELELESELESEKEKSDDFSEEDITRILNFYNKNTTLTKINSLNLNQQAKLANAIKVHGVKRLEACIARAEKSDFLAGRKDNGFKADLNWIVAHVDRIMSGDYDDYKKDRNASALNTTGCYESSISDEMADEMFAAALARSLDDWLDQ